MSDTQNEDDAVDSGAGPRQIETFDQLEEKLFKDGDYRIQYSNDTIVFRLHSTEPKAQGSGAVDAVISMTLTNKFATLSTLLTRDIFDAEGSVGGVAETLLLRPQNIYSASAEIQYIESEIKTHLGLEVQTLADLAITGGYPKEGFIEQLSKECADDDWRQNRLRTILDCLVDRRNIQQGVGDFRDHQAVRDVFPVLDDFASFTDHQFEQGFLLARLITEYFTRYQIGSLAERGLSATEAQESRVAGSGRRSSEKKRRRIEMVLARMEELLIETPAFARIGIKALSELALKDCIKVDSGLWSQGKKQLNAYIDIIKSDIRYRDRYIDIKRKTA